VIDLPQPGGSEADGVPSVEAATKSGEEITRRMFSIWQKLFPGERITEDSDFFDLGGDSLLVVRLQALMGNEFDLRLTMADATEYFTPAGHVQWVKEMRASGGHRRGTAEMNPAVLPLQREGHGAPIFVIPQMLNFRTFAEELGREQPVYGLQIMDEDVTEKLATATFEEMASIYCELIREAQPAGPYRLAGWCLWGWMAYEVAHQLEAQGAEVEMLAIIDAWAPGYWTRYSPVRQFFVNASHFGQRITWYVDSMRNLPAGEQFKDGFRRLREVGASLVRALPRGLRPEMPVVEMLRIQKYASKAAESYKPGPIKANVVLFKSELRPTGHFIGEDMGWGAVLGREVKLDTLPGNHNDIFYVPSARVMAGRMRRALGLEPLPESIADGRR
jgi:thioesterase domain-containing protein/acyl carrier protein